MFSNQMILERQSVPVRFRTTIYPTKDKEIRLVAMNATDMFCMQPSGL